MAKKQMKRYSTSGKYKSKLYIRMGEIKNNENIKCW